MLPCGTPGAAKAVDLIDKDDGGCPLPCHLEQNPYHAFRLSPARQQVGHPATSYHLTQCDRAHDGRAKSCRFSDPVSADISICTLFTCNCGLCGCMGRISRDGVKLGRDSRKSTQMKIVFSLSQRVSPVSQIWLQTTVKTFTKKP
jgi:hypothetical protein